jgi:hypothetical protein
MTLPWEIGGPGASLTIKAVLVDLEVRVMEFLSLKEFNSSPRKTRKSLRKNGKIVF